MPGHTFVLMQLWQRLWAHMLLMAVRLANGESSAAVKPEVGDNCERATDTRRTVLGASTVPSTSSTTRVHSTAARMVPRANQSAPISMFLDYDQAQRLSHVGAHKKLGIHQIVPHCCHANHVEADKKAMRCSRLYFRDREPRHCTPSHALAHRGKSRDGVPHWDQ